MNVMTTLQMQPIQRLDPLGVDDPMELSGDHEPRDRDTEDIDLDFQVADEGQGEVEDANMEEDGTFMTAQTSENPDEQVAFNDDEMVDDNYLDETLSDVQNAEDEAVDDDDVELEDEHAQEEAEQFEHMDPGDISHDVPAEEITASENNITPNDLHEDLLGTEDQIYADDLGAFEDIEFSKQLVPLPDEQNTELQTAPVAESSKLEISELERVEPQNPASEGQTTASATAPTSEAEKDAHTESKEANPARTDKQTDDTDTIPREEAALDGTETQTHERHNSKHMHPIVVNCQGVEMSLFPPIHEAQEYSETFLLAEQLSAEGAMKDLLEACRSVLADSIGDGDELIFEFHDLGLRIGEHSPHASQISLVQILDTYKELQRQDGVHQAPPLYANLYTSFRPLNRLQFLQAAVAKGDGFAKVKVTDVERHNYDDVPENEAGTNFPETDLENRDAKPRSQQDPSITNAESFPDASEVVDYAEESSLVKPEEFLNHAGLDHFATREESESSGPVQESNLGKREEVAKVEVERKSRDLNGNEEILEPPEKPASAGKGQPVEQESDARDTPGVAGNDESNSPYDQEGTLLNIDMGVSTLQDEPGDSNNNEKEAYIPDQQHYSADDHTNVEFDGSGGGGQEDLFFPEPNGQTETLHGQDETYLHPFSATEPSDGKKSLAGSSPKSTHVDASPIPPSSDIQEHETNHSRHLDDNIEATIVAAETDDIFDPGLEQTDDHPKGLEDSKDLLLEEYEIENFDFDGDNIALQETDAPLPDESGGVGQALDAHSGHNSPQLPSEEVVGLLEEPASLEDHHDPSKPGEEQPVDGDDEISYDDDDEEEEGIDDVPQIVDVDSPSESLKRTRSLHDVDDRADDDQQDAKRLRSA